jgi:hypothetical protein
MPKSLASHCNCIAYMHGEVTRIRLQCTQHQNASYTSALSIAASAADKQCQPKLSTCHYVRDMVRGNGFHWHPRINGPLAACVDLDAISSLKSNSGPKHHRIFIPGTCLEHDRIPCGQLIILWGQSNRVAKGSVHCNNGGTESQSLAVLAPLVVADKTPLIGQTVGSANEL